MPLVGEGPAPILGMETRPPPDKALEYGNAASYWVEYPSGLIDVSRSKHIDSRTGSNDTPPPIGPDQLDIPVNAGRTIRVKKNATALVVIDMQK